MGEVYRNRAVQLARLPGVQAEVEALADAIAARATAILRANHKPGNDAKGSSPTISVDHSGVDSTVTLSDPDGGALAIEFGRSGGVDRRGRRVGPMAPIAPLRGAI